MTRDRPKLAGSIRVCPRSTATTSLVVAADAVVEPGAGERRQSGGSGVAAGGARDLPSGGLRLRGSQSEARRCVRRRTLTSYSSRQPQHITHIRVMYSIYDCTLIHSLAQNMVFSYIVSLEGHTTEYRMVIPITQCPCCK